jgi:hypothetical protein
MSLPYKTSNLDTQKRGACGMISHFPLLASIATIPQTTKKAYSQEWAFLV